MNTDPHPLELVREAPGLGDLEIKICRSVDELPDWLADANDRALAVEGLEDGYGPVVVAHRVGDPAWPVVAQTIGDITADDLVFLLEWARDATRARRPGL